jgi:hypothetical protein
MKKLVVLFFLVVCAKWAAAQKIDSIYFHLYTDSLKKGFTIISMLMAKQQMAGGYR